VYGVSHRLRLAPPAARRCCDCGKAFFVIFVALAFVVLVTFVCECGLLA
jgi:hypothetical protein